MACEIDLDLSRRRLDTLPMATRAVFLLHRIDALDYGEIAWRLDIGIDEVERSPPFRPFRKKIVIWTIASQEKFTTPIDHSKNPVSHYGTNGSGFGGCRGFMMPRRR